MRHQPSVAHPPFTVAQHLDSKKLWGCFPPLLVGASQRDTRLGEWRWRLLLGLAAGRRRSPLRLLCVLRAHTRMSSCSPLAAPVSSRHPRWSFFSFRPWWKSLVRLLLMPYIYSPYYFAVCTHSSYFSHRRVPVWTSSTHIPHLTVTSNLYHLAPHPTPL